MITKKDDYNNVPVKYCKKCLDLKILLFSSGKKISNDIEYCGNCGSTEIDECHIDNFNKKHIELYGEDYLTRNKSVED